ncbi:MAG TPA: YraN family protein [Thermodesulfobacteriota bacterium]|nr:YraN family protein [Thermodesulfobacteriota bacterium]
MFREFLKFKVKPVLSVLSLSKGEGEENPSFDCDRDRPEERLSVGKSGEDEAVRLLEKKGYKILERNYRTRYGEADIVAKDGQTLVFVEVKKRRSARYGSAKEAVGRRKMRRLAMVAKDYISKRREGLAKGLNARFDVVSIETHRDSDARVEHVIGAFEDADGF